MVWPGDGVCAVFVAALTDKEATMSERENFFLLLEAIGVFLDEAFSPEMDGEGIDEVAEPGRGELVERSSISQLVDLDFREVSDEFDEDLEGLSFEAIGVDEREEFLFSPGPVCLSNEALTSRTSVSFDSENEEDETFEEANTLLFFA